MKIIYDKQIKRTELDVEFTGGNSLRLLTKKDELGFSVNKTIIKKGGPYRWHYPNHVEACYCISGKGVLTSLDTGEKFNVIPGSVYAVDNHDDHTFEALEKTILVSVFNPPLKGSETHDQNGQYK